MTEPTLLALAGLLLGGGGMAGFLTARAQARKTNAEANATSADADATVVETVLKVMDELRGELERLHKKVEETQRKYERVAKSHAEASELLRVALAENASLLKQVERFQRRLKVAQELLAEYGVDFDPEAD